MNIIGVDHITINMVRVKETQDFYEKIFGLEKLEEVDLGDHVLHLYQLPGLKLELIEYKEEQKRIEAGNTDIGIYRHFAVTTDNLEACRISCEEAGYGINLLPSYISEIGKTVMLIKDPNGVEIEVIQA